MNKEALIAVTSLQRVATLNDIPQSARLKLCELLNTILAETIDLELQTKQAHWNVKGIQFYALHGMFDDLAGVVHSFIDLLGERCAALGGYASGSVRISATQSGFEDYPIEAFDGKAHLEALILRYAKFSANVRRAMRAAEDLGDRATADLFTQLSRAADKNLWMLESHVQI